MKKLGYLLVGISVMFMASCSERSDVIEEMSTLKAKTAVAEGISSPMSDMEVYPYIIAGDNKGGNRTCDEVATAFGATFDLCGDKIDYDGDFMGSFPDGLMVTTDGTYVSFEMDNCIDVEGEWYKVGAVIVKGSNAANVYYYPDGTLSDSGLASPENSSGKPAGLSNLTFCFVKCDVGVAIKMWYVDEGNILPALSNGAPVFTDGWCANLGFNSIMEESPITLTGFNGDDIGHFLIENMGDHVQITINLDEEYELKSSYIFVGSKLGLMNSAVGDCPDYESWVVKYSNLFTIPF